MDDVLRQTNSCNTSRSSWDSVFGNPIVTTGFKIRKSATDKEMVASSSSRLWFMVLVLVLILSGNRPEAGTVKGLVGPFRYWSRPEYVGDFCYFSACKHINYVIAGTPSIMSKHLIETRFL